ncbi:unnamed protein product [Pleuronectes platessa]|uniref:PDZ domain-containing protein n=1 Tax=Pleuronectes platessa TaxID=8262 RepID=A0A9N7VEP3_PLEPL|nr:unnamed protein product [Pleuronectes platessa]
MRRFLSRKGRFSLRQSKSGTRSASKDFYLGLPATNQNWPEAFGFRLGGTGPSYILSVVEGSSAYLAGLQPGDQVVDIEGQDVTNLSTPALVALAQTLKTVPPSIGVVSTSPLVPDGRFGFTIVGDSPLMVEDCMPSGPAGRSGLKVGDYVMEVNGIPVKHHETAAAMIKAAQGRPLRLGVLSMARRPKRLSSSMRVLSQSGDSVRDSRAHKAMEFNKKVEEVLGEEPDVKEQLFDVLKQYAAERDVDSLAEALPDILITEEHQQLIDSVRNSTQGYEHNNMQILTLHVSHTHMHMVPALKFSAGRNYALLPQNLTSRGHAPLRRPRSPRRFALPSQRMYSLLLSPSSPTPLFLSFLPPPSTEGRDDLSLTSFLCQMMDDSGDEDCPVAVPGKTTLW